MTHKASTGKRTRQQPAQTDTGNEMEGLVAHPVPGLDSDALFRTLIENINEVIFSVDLTGCFTYISPAIEQNSGFPPASVIGLPFLRFVHPEDAPKAKKSFEEAIGGVDNLSVDFRVVNARGEIWYAHVSTRLLFSNGKISGLTGVMTDITERNQAEQALRRSEQEKRAILNAIPDIMFHLDRNGVFLDFKADNEKQLLAAPGDFLGKRLQDVLPGWLASLTRKHLKAVLSGGKIQVYEYSLDLEGGKRYFEARMVPFQENQALTIVRDVTEQKQAEQATQDAEQKYRALVEQIPAIVYTDSANEVGKTHYVSPQIKKLLGFDPEEYSKNNDLWTNALHPEDRERVLAEYTRTYQNGEPFHIEYRLFSASGQVFWIRDDAVLIRDQTGAPLIWQGIMLNITERKLTESALRASEEQYRKMVELSPEAIAVHAGGKILYVNPSGLKVIGANRADELIGKPVLSFVHPDSVPQAVERIRQTLASQTASGALHEKFIRLDGSVIDVEVSNMPLVYDGKPAIQVMIRDITVQQRVEEERRLQSQRLETLFHLSQMKTDSLEELTDYALEQAVLLTGSAMGYIMLVNDDETLLTLHSWTQGVLQDAQTGNREYRFQVQETGLWGEAIRQRRPVITNDYQKDDPAKKGLPPGHTPLSRHMNVPVFDGERIVIVAGVGNKAGPYNELDVQQLTLLMDGVWKIIRRKQAEDALRISEASYRGLFNSVREGVYIQEKDGTFLDVNQGVVDMYGYPREFFIGKSPADLSAPGKNDLEHLGVMLERAFAGEPQKFEFWGVRKNGEIFPKEVRLYKGAYFGRDILFALAQDITDRKRTEESLHRRDVILEAVAFASEQFLKSPDWTQSIDAVLNRLCCAADASRVYIFENFPDPTGDLLTRQRFEWCAPGVPSQAHLAALQHVSYRKDGFGRWRKKMEGNSILAGNVTGLPPKERDLLAIQGVVSVLIMPIFVGTRWWGFIGFDECRQAREWLPVEVEALKMAASLLGATIQKLETENARQRQLRELEVLHAVSVACMQAVIADQVIENVTGIVTDMFQLHSFGVLMYDPRKKLLFLHPSYQGAPVQARVPTLLGQGIAGCVAETRRLRRVGSVHKEKRCSLIHPESLSGLCVPILAGEKLIGVLNAESSQEDFFTPDTERLFSTISVTMATAMEKLSLFAAEFIHRQEAEKLRDASSTLTSSLELDPLLDNILESLVEITHHDSASIVLREKNGLRVAAARGIPETIAYKDRVFPLNQKWETIIQTRQPLILEDAQSSPAFEKWAGSDYIRGWMGVPLLTRGELVGCLCLDSRTPDAFTQEQAALVQTFANHAASAIENARLFSNERSQRYRQDAMVDLMKIAGSSLDLDTVLENTLVYLLRLVPGRAGSVQLLEGDALRVAAIIGYDEAQIQPGIYYSLEKYPLNRQIVLEKCAICLGDTTLESRYVHRPDLGEIRSFLGVPLIFKDDVIGVITVDSEQTDAFSEQDTELALAVARNISIAIENARLFKAEQTRHQEAETLRLATSAIASTLNWENAIRLILEQLSQVVPCDSASVQLFENGYTEIVGGQGWPADQPVMGMRFPIPGENPNTVVIETRQPLLLNNAPTQYPTFLEGMHQHILSWLGAPMIVRDQVIGMLAVDSMKKDHFTAESARLVSAFASQAAVAIENARLYEQAVKAAERRAILHQASEEIARSSQDTEKVYDAVHRAAQRLMPAEAFVISLLDEIQEDVFSVYLYDKDGRWPPAHSPLESGISGQIIATGTGIIINDFMNSPSPNAIHFGSEDEVHSVLAVPMRTGNKVIGMLSAQSYQANAYTEEDQHLLEMLAAYAAVAIDNARLFDQNRQRRIEAETLRQVTQVITSSLDVSESLRLMLEQTKRLFRFDTASILFLGVSGQPSLIAGINYANEKMTSDAANELLKDSPILRQMSQDLKPVTIADVRQHPGWIWVPGAEHVRSFLAVPLISRQRMIGAFMADSDIPDHFSEEETRVAQLLAEQMAIALENAGLYQQALRAAERRGILHRVSQDIVTAIQEPEQTYHSIHQATRQLMPCDSFVIGLHESKSNENIIVYALEGDHRFPLQRIPAGKGLIGAVVASGESVIVDDQLVEKKDVIRVGSVQPIRSFVAVPLRLGTNTTGMLSAQSYTARAYGPEEREILEMLASYAAVAIENARLYQEARRAAERRSILHEVSQEIVKASLDPERVYEAMHHAAERLMPAEAFVLSVLDESTNEIVFAYLFDEGKRWYAERSPAGTGLSGRVIESGKPLIVNDLQTTPLSDGNDFGEGDEVRSVLAVPLRLGEKVLGMLSVQSYQPYSYSEEDQALLEMLGAHAAVAIDNARLFDQIQRRRVEAESLRDATAALTSALEIDQVMSRLLDALAQVIPYDSATVFLRDGDSLVGKVAHGLVYPDKVIGQKFPASDLLFQFILETRGPLVLPDVHEDERFQYYGETDTMHGWMGIPLIIRDEVAGILTIDSRTPGAYASPQAELALAFANQAASAVEKARLFEETLHRLAELEVVNRVSTQLRAAEKVEEMLPCLLNEALQAFHTDSGSIWLYDPASGLLKTPLEQGWFLQLGETPLKPGEGIAGHVFSTGKAIISREFSSDPLLEQNILSRIPPGWGGGCVPIRTGREIIGVMFIAVPLPRELQESDVHLLTTLCEIAGNAIHRADLHEQTGRQLQRLASLRTIDMAISTILDLRVTLGILIDHIISQLKVDAVNVLLINPSTQTLYHAASSGFRSDAVKNSQVYVNDGLALQAIRSRATVFIPNLSQSSLFSRLQLLTSEGFITYFGVPLIAKGQVKGILETFHRHPTDPDMDWRGFLETLAGEAAIAIDNSLLFEELQQTNLNLSLAYDATIEGWSKALDLRDRETEGHTLRVTELTLRLADAMGVNAGDLVHIRRGALLHDIGKMGVPDSILHKTGPLTEEEWLVMRRHPEFAYAMLSPISYLRPALDVPYCHHERWNGSGYPRGLKEDQIPIAARMFAVVDVYDALTSTRPYRAGWTQEAAIEFIHKNTGILFDPYIVDAFLRMLAKGENRR